MTPSNKYVIKFTALILSIRSYIILINIDIINKISNLVKENSNVYSLNWRPMRHLIITAKCMQKIVCKTFLNALSIWTQPDRHLRRTPELDLQWYMHANERWIISSDQILPASPTLWDNLFMFCFFCTTTNTGLSHDRCPVMLRSPGSVSNMAAFFFYRDTKCFACAKSFKSKRHITAVVRIHPTGTLLESKGWILSHMCIQKSN